MSRKLIHAQERPQQRLVDVTTTVVVGEKELRSVNGEDSRSEDLKFVMGSNPGVNIKLDGKIDH